MSLFAVIGTMLFGTTKAGYRLSDQANFRSFPASLLTLSQLLLGDDWFTLMIDCNIQPPLCTARFSNFAEKSKLSYGDCGNALSPLYFLVSLYHYSIIQVAN